MFRQPASPWREDGIAKTRPPGRKGTRAGTGDAEGERDHATSTGAVADGWRLGLRRARKLAMAHGKPELSSGQSHAGDRRPRVDRAVRAPASPKSSAIRVIRAATSRKIVSIALSFGHHLSSPHSRMAMAQIDNAAWVAAMDATVSRHWVREGCRKTIGAWDAPDGLTTGSGKI